MFYYYYVPERILWRLDGKTRAATFGGVAALSDFSSTCV
jgi:hypothetical protein